MEKPKNIILEGVVGSTAYGLATPTSDVDVKGIYVAPIFYVLGLDGPQAVSKTVDNTSPDWSYHEVGKFVSLALKCNPTTLEMLWLNSYSVISIAGGALLEHRKKFLSDSAIRGAYGAYAKAQAERLLRRAAEGKEGFSSDTKARTEKHGRHCMRLLIQGTELLQNATMNVDMSEYREYLFEMGRLAANDPPRFFLEYQYKAQEFNTIKGVLPERPERERLNRLLIGIRLDEWNGV